MSKRACLFFEQCLSALVSENVYLFVFEMS
jgi:hypothetical protein